MAALACMAPPTVRTAISPHSELVMAVPKKLTPKPMKPNSNTGRRPKRSDKAPSTGDAKKLATPNDTAATPYQ